jgi:hypothetical protein
MASTVVRAHGHTRSTQSFVYTMVSVWKRPSLMALEILWRWSAGVPILVCVAYWGVRHWAVLHAQFELLSGETLFKPVAAVAALQGVLGTLWALAEPALVWFVPVALLVWAAAGAFGKNMVARRMDPETKAVAMTLFPLRLLRLLGIVLCLGLWGAIAYWLQMATLVRPAAEGGEPNVVLFLAMMIVVSLTLFVGWALTSWPLELAQTLAMRYEYSAVRALREALELRKLRGEVMEVNLVLCIVRIALLVLLMVFSACPLPFESVETTTFLVSWTCGVGIWYLCMSDFFHAVRLAAYAALESADRDLR